MSRMQDILDKAERDGRLNRVSTTTLSPSADVPANAVASAARSVVMDFGTTAPAVAAPLDEPLPQATAPVPHRVVTGAPLDRALVAALDPASTTAEQYRALRTRILHADMPVTVNAVLVTSPGRGEGKSVTAANLALTMGQEFQRRICLVDANLRASRLHQLFSIPEEPGLSDVIAGRATLDEALLTLEDHNLAVLVAGARAEHPAELLGSTGMRRLLDTLRSQFDCLVIDAPAAAPLADVRILAPLVDCALLVVRSGLTTKPSIHEAAGTIEPSKLLGLVLNEAAA